MTNTLARDIAIYSDLKQQLMAEFDLLGDDDKQWEWREGP